MSVESDLVLLREAIATFDEVVATNMSGMETILSDDPDGVEVLDGIKSIVGLAQMAIKRILVLEERCAAAYGFAVRGMIIQASGPGRYVISRGGACLGIDGEWHPTPDRIDKDTWGAFVAATTIADLETAWSLMEKVQA